MTTLGSKMPGVPTSLTQAGAETAAARRAYKNVIAANAVPTTKDDGFHANGKRWLHITIDLPDSGSSLVWALYLWDPIAELWCLDTRLGSSGLVPLAYADVDNPQRSIIEIGGTERVALVFSSVSGMTQGASVWLSSSGEVDGG